MGYSRPRSKHLAAKLLQIRRNLGISQTEMVKQLGVEIPYNNISKYELDKNEPPLFVLLAYSRASQIPLEQIVDDNMEIPT
jgi:Helix-turn-helix.